MHVAHGTYARAGVAGSRKGMRRGSSGNLSVEELSTEQSPPGQAGGSSPGSVGGRSSTTVVESALRRVQHAVNVFLGGVSAAHTDFLARRGLLVRQLLSISESVLVVFALTVIGTVIFSRLERDAVSSAQAQPRRHVART